MSEGYVYVIGARNQPIVKIGRSADPQKRVAAIQTMSPMPLEVLWTHPGGHFEAKLHRHFAHLRTHGEWFDFVDQDPVHAVQNAIDNQVWDTPTPQNAVEKVPRQPRTCNRCGHQPHRGDLCWSEGCYDTGADAFPVCSCPVEPVQPSA